MASTLLSVMLVLSLPLPPSALALSRTNFARLPSSKRPLRCSLKTPPPPLLPICSASFPSPRFHFFASSRRSFVPFYPRVNRSRLPIMKVPSATSSAASTSALGLAKAIRSCTLRPSLPWPLCRRRIVATKRLLTLSRGRSTSRFVDD